MYQMTQIMQKQIVLFLINLDQFAVSQPKTDKDLYIFNEESKQNVVEYDLIKKQYYKAKFHAKKEEYIKK